MKITNITACILSFFLFNFVLFVFGSLSFSQGIISTAGGDQEGIGGSVSFSIGQTSFQTFVSDSGSVAEGVQHPYEIFVVSVTDNISGKLLNLNAFPNPFDSYLVLAVDAELIPNLRFELFDSGGRLIRMGQVSSIETRIEVASLYSGVYILRVFRAEKELKAFKVIKK